MFRNFNLEVCDKCKDTEKDGKHELITKTDSKNEFLLQDTHFEREPPLKFISRKNPHHQSWGEMKLFLRVQVEKRALEVWGELNHVECVAKEARLKILIMNSKKNKSLSIGTFELIIF